MSRVTLAANVNFGLPAFGYTTDTAQLDPAIDGKAKSLAVFPGADFEGAVFFPNLTFRAHLPLSSAFSNA